MAPLGEGELPLLSPPTDWRVTGGQTGGRTATGDGLDEARDAKASAARSDARPRGARSPLPRTDSVSALKAVCTRRGLRVPTQDAKFDRGLDVENVNALGFEPVEQPGCFLCRDSDLHFNRLVGKLKKMRRMDATAAGESFAAGMERSAPSSNS